MSVKKIGDRVLTTTPERDAYAALRWKYQKEARSKRDSFVADFPRTFSNADELFVNFPTVLAQFTEEAINVALSDITSHQVYDVDERAFGERFASRLSDVKSKSDELYGKYQEIALSAAELEAYRAQRAANRAGLIGGGFGVEGAAKGMAVAAGINVALGIAHGIANATGGAISAIGDRRKKAHIYNDPMTRNGFADIVFDTVFEAHMVVAEMINERCDAVVFEPVNGSDKLKADVLLNNVLKGRVPEDARADVLFESLTLDPFVEKTWSEWLSRFGDADGSLASAGKSVGVIEIDKWKRALIAEQLALLPTGTPEQCHHGIMLLEQKAELLSITIDSERSHLLDKANKLDIERRSFGGKIYDTEEEAVAARLVQLDIERRTFNGNIYETEQDAKDAEEELKNRTLFGIVYDNHEEAKQAYLEYKRIKSRKNKLGAMVVISIFVALIMISILLERLSYTG